MYTETIKLDDVITDIAAGPFGSNLKVSCFVDYGFPIIDGANLKGFKVTDNITKYVNEEKARSLHRSIARKNDVVVTISGTLGQIAYIPENSMFEEYLCSQRQFRVTFDTDKVYVPYLVYYFHSREGQHKILSFANQTGVPALSQPLKNFRNIEVNLPDINTQKRIASVLNSLDDKIELNTKINENLHQLIAAYYAEIFKDCEYSATISDYADKVFSGGTPTTSNETYWNGEFNWLSSGETSQRFIVRTEKTITQEGVDNSSTRLASKYNTVIASAGQGHTRGQTSMLLTDTYINQSIIVIDSEKIYMPFIYWNLCGRYEELRVISNSNSIRGSLTTKMISSFSAPKADIALISKFSDLAWSAIYEIEKNSNEIVRLTALRDTLLPKLMNGEIDVSQVKI